ncbi:TlpA family protein disulfide reductase [Clostridium sartagoforme]|uniref:TlpA family protein disulfide reductase n=1 Tax=Clostridium sartagoforme TaxID=84031 RepID=A0A4S2DRL6_9CLOT|nr:TlpA disulfide reductase family protein [Clostridium sartagoforme]TGY43833.1 TlpA family protein disulfide reductase [Clostridium sartagoforme]
MKNIWKVILLTLVLVVLILVVKFGYGYLTGQYLGVENSNIKQELKEANDFEVYDEEGSRVKLSDYKGSKPVVINIWASWCGPCKAEMPYFEDAINKYSDKVEFLMINLTDGQRETKEKALKFLKDNNLEMDILFDLDYSAANAYNIRGIPRTIFIDKVGNIIYDREGALNDEILETNIKKLIK